MEIKAIRQARGGLPEPPELERTQLFGWRLWLARGAVLSVVVLSLVLFVVGIPHRFIELKLLSSFARDGVKILLADQPQIFEIAQNLLRAYPYGALGIEALLMGLMLIAAAVILWRRSTDQVALLLAAGLVTYGAYIIPTIDALMVARPEFTLAANIVQASGLICAMLFLYTFPNGRFVPFFTAYLFIIWVAWSTAWVINPSLPINHSRPFDQSLTWFLVLIAWWASGVLAQFYRYRHVSNVIERQQTKYIVYGILFVMVGYLFYVPTRYLIPPGDELSFARILFNLTGIPVFLLLVFAAPLTVTFSILRFRLWDIDVVINRTMVFGLLTGVLAFLYVSSILLLQYIFELLTSHPRSELVTAISTLIIAALFQPVRNRIQNVIERNFYRRKYDAEKTLTQFSELMRAEVDLDRLADGLQQVLKDTMQPEHISLLLIQSGDSNISGSWLPDFSAPVARHR